VISLLFHLSVNCSYEIPNTVQTNRKQVKKGEQHMKKLHLIILLVVLLSSCPLPASAKQADKESDAKLERMALYKKTAAATGLPWYYLAAIDQYEHNLPAASKSEAEKLIAITIPEEKWFGITEHKKAAANESTISWFQGLGRDGNGDSLADPNNPEDVLYTIASFIQRTGTTKDDFKIALWNYYERDLTVQTIMNTAKLYEQFDTIELDKRSFPLPLHHNYSYRNTWGDARGFGGRRIHEGTDIFANYGVPVYATTYGVVELKGWNLYGGWRIGLRDSNNIYHYYAHLNGFEKGVSVGNVVKPGDVIGYVGASGYGPPGTSGKFPPHLHYGMYKDNGRSEFSFDPYPYLRIWEQKSKQQKKEG
jgi:peptidoglycan LD-endopeptidase LytH